MFKFLSRSAAAGEHHAGAGGAERTAEGPGRTARRDLLDRIADFLVRHDLEVSAPNLALAQAACRPGPSHSNEISSAPLLPPSR